MKQNNINKINAETADEITLCLRHNTDLGRAAITCTNRVYDDEPERTDIICDNLDEDGNPQCNGCWTPWSTRNTKW